MHKLVMDETSSSSHSPPPFLTKIYEMVDDPSIDSIISWDQNDRSFIVWNQEQFSRELLPRFFKHNNFSSFIRQLNTYGFRKIDPEQWAFSNDDFIRGHPQLLKNIHRRKPVHSHTFPKQQSFTPLTDSEREGYRVDIERLTHDKEALVLELQRQKEEKQRHLLQIEHLKDRLQHMNQCQQTLESHFTQILQKPASALSFLPSMEAHNGKRKLLTINSFSDASDAEENCVATSNTAKAENLDAARTSGLLEFLGSSLTSMEGILDDCHRASVEEAVYGGGEPAQPFTDVLAEIDASSGGTDINLQLQSPRLNLSSHSSKDVNSSAELVESVSLAECPGTSYIQLGNDWQSKPTGIDMNCNPDATAPKLTALKEQAVGRASPVRSGVNDGFWAQFLTENPGSSTQEVQLERKDVDIRSNEGKPGGHAKFWWNANNFLDQMGQLTPAERT